jgi:heme exporter protein A
MTTLQAVAVDDVRKIFGRFPALSGVNCDFQAGQVTLLMGPNGAGKSTLLSILAVLSRPTSGQVRYGDYSHREVEVYLRQLVGFVSHAPLLYADLSARENLRFFGKLYGVNQLDERVDAWLRRTDLVEAADRPLHQFSRGMIQRVALGRALLHDPPLLLLDEPFTALDRAGIALLRDTIAETRDRGRVIIIATHDTEAVDRLCDAQLLLRRGRVAAYHRQAGLTADQLKEHYHATLR